MPRPREASFPIALATRGLLAGLAITTYLATRGEMNPAAQAGARFGLGVLLFALLVDLGRTVAGTGPPIRGRLSPHRQQARAQTDDAYERLREAVQTYLDQGHVSERLETEIDEVARQRGLDADERRALHARLAAEARPASAHVSLLGVRLLAGLAVTLGLGLAAARLAEALGFVLFPFVLLVTGTSLATLQWRARRSGARWTGLALGLAGLSLFILGALRIYAASPLAGGLLLVLALAGATATAYATWQADPHARPAEDAERRAGKLNRWLVITLGVTVLVFALDAVLSGALASLGLPQPVLEVARILVLTLLAFLLVETAGLWLVRQRGTDEQAPRRRRARLDEVLDEIDDPQASPEEIG